MSQLPLFSFLSIELTSHCNRKCVFCARTYDRSGARNQADGQAVIRHAPTEQVERILRESAELGFTGNTTFFLYSEPFLDDRCCRFGRMARRLGMKPVINTNGDLLKQKPELLKQASESFDHIRIGLYDEKTFAEAEKAKMWWKQRLPSVSFTEMGQVGPRPGAVSAIAHPNDACTRPELNFNVLYDGSLPVCCYDLKSEFGLPNGFDVSVKEAWWNQARQNVFQSLSVRGGRTQYPLCTTCCMPEVGVALDSFGWNWAEKS